MGIIADQPLLEIECQDLSKLRLRIHGLTSKTNAFQSVNDLTGSATWNELRRVPQAELSADVDLPIGTTSEVYLRLQEVP